MKRIKGIAISSGLVSGPVFKLKRKEPEITDLKCTDPQKEWKLFERAIKKVKKDLHKLKANSSGIIGEKGMIYSACADMLDDPELIQSIHHQIFDNKCSAKFALWEVVLHQTEELESLGDKVITARALDLKSIGRRVIFLLDNDDYIEKNIPIKPSIILAQELEISDLLRLPRRIVLGFCIAEGGDMDHTAILIRAYNIPAVFQLGSNILTAFDGQEILLDGNEGVAIIEPDSTSKKKFKDRELSTRIFFQTSLRESTQPCVTLDGFEVKVMANVMSRRCVQEAVTCHADGIGLIRSEFMCFQTGYIPGEDEQFGYYSEILSAFNSKPVTLRTFDFGGDKTLPELEIQPQKNPFLGLRGIRYSLFGNRKLFVCQIRSALKASINGKLRIMLPMITTKSEVDIVKQIIKQVESQLLSEGHQLPVPLPLGIMIETPASAIMVDRLAESIDFFSIGTNDLTQYIMAADRSNPAVSQLVDGLHPAILRTIDHITQKVKTTGKPICVCGELAGDPYAIPLLLGLGITELSVSPSKIPGIKKIIRGLILKEAKNIFRKALMLNMAEDVRALVKPIIKQL